MADCSPFSSDQFSRQASITLRGTSGGGAVSPNANGNIDLRGSGVAIIGDPSTNTLNFFAANASGITWVDVQSSPIALSPNTGYIDHFSGSTEYTLPLTSNLGDVMFIVSGLSSNQGWKVFQNAGQQIVIGEGSTTPGTAGSITSQNPGSVLYLVCSLPNIRWIAISIMGNVQEARVSYS